MATTIYEVAKRSGVSIGTVSRVLNDSPLTAMRTRTRVLQVINELNYQPHAMAQGLARRKSNAIGVVVPLRNGHASTEMLRGIQRSLAARNIDLIFYGIDEFSRKETLLQRALRKSRVEGLLVLSRKPSDTLLQECQRQRLPLVFVDCAHRHSDSFSLKMPHDLPPTARHWIRLGYRAAERMVARMKTPALPARHLCLKPRAPLPLRSAALEE